METLLISPATRLEIVLGKFFTVVLASVMTAVLNLASMAATGIGLASQMAGGGLEPPSLVAAGWMLVLLVPLSIFFSAICVALAVHARSMKEGQYYMTPLYMVSLPLILLTLVYGVLAVVEVRLLLTYIAKGADRLPESSDDDGPLDPDRPLAFAY